ncbi:MAG TPA: hypothetical protein VFJ72_03165 [Rubrobacteraceae bacterium]|nr:hypothetical protein [Rubrobacteraceae bacterium]
MSDVVVRPDERMDEVSTFMGDVRVDGPVAGDVGSAFGNVEIRHPIGGTASSGWGDVYVYAPVRGVAADFGDVYIDAPVAGNVDVEHGNVRLGPDALVLGNLNCGSGQVMGNRSAVRGAVLTGMASDFDRTSGDFKLLGFVGWLFAALVFVACSLLVAVLAPGPVTSASRALEDSPVWSLILGVGTIPAAAVLGVLLAISVVGIPLLLLLAPAYLALIAFGALVVAFFIGRKVVLATGRYRAGNALAAVVGALIVAAVYQIPFLGNLLLYALALLGTGAAILALFSRRGPRIHTYQSPVRQRRDL